MRKREQAPALHNFNMTSGRGSSYGKLTVLTALMNYDLTMGDELLKKTGAGNLFVIYGEPDLKPRREKDGKVVVEIKGVDVYDPTTGQIRSHSTDDIACWFIDTNYNGESFFLRHAYFTGAGDPYEKLKRALRAEIDEAAWSALYSTVSRPFDPPKTGKIAVKVINHYGDEVLEGLPSIVGGAPSGRGISAKCFWGGAQPRRLTPRPSEKVIAHSEAPGIGPPALGTGVGARNILLDNHH